MKTTVKLLNVGDLNCRLTVEVTVSEMRQLLKQIEKPSTSDWLSWPLAGLREAAIETIEKVEREFSTEVKSQ